MPRLIINSLIVVFIPYPTPPPKIANKLPYTRLLAISASIKVYAAANIRLTTDDIIYSYENRDFNMKKLNNILNGVAKLLNNIADVMFVYP